MDLVKALKSNKHKTLRMLAIIGALFGTRPALQAAETENDRKLQIQAEVGLKADVEGGINTDGFADASLSPHFRLEKDGYALDYDGCFWNQWNFDGTEREWLTLKHRLLLENKDYAIGLGRDLTAGQMTGYKNAPATTDFANTIKTHGTSHPLTGINLWDKQRGLQIGWNAKNAEFGYENLDMLVLGYRKQLNKQWGVHLQLGTGRSPVDYAAATVAYTPNKDNAVVGEFLYKNERTSGILMTKHKLSEDWTLFANGEITKHKNTKTTAKLEAGVSYDIGKGVNILAAVQQEIGEKHPTRAVLGLQCNGNLNFLSR